MPSVLLIILKGFFAIPCQLLLTVPACVLSMPYRHSKRVPQDKFCGQRFLDITRHFLVLVAHGAVA